MTDIADVRMYDYVSSGVQAVLGQFVGEGQTPLPTRGADLDATRKNAKAKLRAFLGTMLQPSAPQLAAASVSLAVTNTTIDQGFLAYLIYGKTLKGIEFAFGLVGVGSVGPDRSPRTPSRRSTPSPSHPSARRAGSPRTRWAWFVARIVQEQPAWRSRRPADSAAAPDKSIIITSLVDGSSVSLGGRVTSIASSSDDKVETIEGIDNGGRVDHEVFSNGWKGKITLDRYNGDADTFFAAIEAARYSAQGDPQFEILESIVNRSNGPDQEIKYTFVHFHNFDAGDWKESIVPISVEFVCQERMPQ